MAGVGGVRWVQVVRLAGVRRGTIHRRRPGAVCVAIASSRRAVRRLRHCLLRLRTVKLVLGAGIRWRRRRPVLGAVEFGSGGEATGGGELIQKLPSGQIHYTRSEEHTSELQSLMRISYAVFCLKKKKKTQTRTQETNTHTKRIQ